MHSINKGVNRLKSLAVYLLLFPITLIINSCASISQPVGGKKDITPPVVLYTFPQQQAINFKGNKIIIGFDEKINIAKLKEKIVITPYYGQNFELDTKGNKMILKFLDTLKPHETYTINYSNGLIDLHEGNPIKLFKQVFSTGDKIDTMSIYGKVVNNYTKEPIANAVVGLYRIGDTINPETKTPYYFGLTNESGKYALTNLKKGEYELFAFNDVNKDMLFDIRKEKIGFLPNTLSLKTPINDSITIEIDRSDVEAPNLLSIKNETEIMLAFNEGIYKYKLEANQNLYNTQTEKGKEIIIYKNQYCEDSIPVKVTVTDSSYNDTTFNVKIVQTQPKKFKRYKDIIKAITPEDKYQITDSLPITIKLTEPLINERDSSIVISMDSNFRYGIQYLSLNKNFKKDNSNTLYSYTYKSHKKPKKFILLQIKSGRMFTSINDTNKAYNLKYDIQKPIIESDISYAKININTKELNYMVELLDEKYQILFSDYNKKNITYKDLKPGNYHIRVFIDDNKDKKWDLGNYRLKKKSEKVIVFKNILPVIKNWDIEDIELAF